MDTKQKRIFLVDDDMTNLHVGKRALSNFYNVYTLSSGIAFSQKYTTSLTKHRKRWNSAMNIFMQGSARK